MYVYVCMYVCMYECMYVCMYICMYVIEVHYFLDKRCNALYSYECSLTLQPCNHPLLRAKQYRLELSSSGLRLKGAPNDDVSIIMYNSVVYIFSLCHAFLIGQ